MPSRQVHQSARCKAHSTRTGDPCKRWAIVGAAVCATHGGAAPQVKQAAEDRLRALVDPAITALGLLLAADDERTRLGAIKDVLDRAGFKPVERREHSGPDGGPIQTEDMGLSDDDRATRILAIVQRARERAALGGTPGDENKV